MKTFTRIILLCFLLGVSGCGPKNPDGRVDVTGTITLNGQPLAFPGGIFFDPVSGIKGDGGSVQTEHGKFHLTGQSAPKPGKYIVRLTAVDYYDINTKEPMTENTPPNGTYTVKLIPDDFGVKSQIEFEAVKGKKNVFNYDIIAPDFKPVRIN